MLKNEDGFVANSPSDGPALEFDFPGLEIGIAEYDEGPTGCTVLRFAETALCEVDVRGGSPGLMGTYGVADAICFAGGSLYGLEASSGVAAELMAERKTGVWGKIGCVSGAIIYDFGCRDTLCYPDKTLGRAAYRARSEGRFPLGQRGAGRSATVGKLNGSTRFAAEPGGQGAAAADVEGLRIAIFTIVNSVGAVVDEKGDVLRGYLHRETGKRHHLRDIIQHYPSEVTVPFAPVNGNTTVTALVIDQQLEREELRQLGRQVHAAMARVIQPFHTMNDGDILFTLTTSKQPRTKSVLAIGEIGSDLACKAVRSAVAPLND